MSENRLDKFADDYMELMIDLVETMSPEVEADPQILHRHLEDRLRLGRRAVNSDEQWHLVAYALAAWTDELLLQLDWRGKSWWNDHVLEATLFGSRVCSERFFELAKVAAQDPGSGVLRIYQDCVLTGFQGVYSLGRSAQSITESIGIPSSLPLWLDDVRRQVAGAASTTLVRGQHRNLTGAPPMSYRKQIVWWTLAASVLLIINVTMFSIAKLS